MTDEKFNRIEIYWDGPFNFKQVAEAQGLYQIYGTHPTNGCNNLLYIGKASKYIDVRFESHLKWWINYEASECCYFKGKIVNETLGREGYDNSKIVSIAESLLIYYCQPPYNSSQKGSLIYEQELEDKNIVVMNFGKRNLLPYEVSTMHYFSTNWENKTKQTS